MKRFASLLLCAALFVALFSACAGGSGTTTTTAAPSDDPSWIGTTTAVSETITVTDHAGHTVEVPKNIERIAVCDIYPLASVLTVFFNSAEKLVAIPDASMTAAKNGLLGELYPDILNVETKCVSGSINTEELTKLAPDVVFYSASDESIGDTLRNAGFTAVALSVNKWDYACIETLNQWITLLSTMFPENDKAAAVKAYSDEAYAYVQQRVSVLSEDERARIFVMFQYSDTNLMTSGEKFFGQWWCDAIGAVNVAQELPNDNAAPVNLEQVYAWNPGAILITNFTKAQPADILNSTIGSDDWSGIDAVKDGRVYKMPLGMYRSYTPGADTPVTLYWLAKTVYPALFEDLDVTAKAKEYYHAVFGVELTDAQVESIFAPVSDAGNVILN
ncbi:MAG: ABC transporter substrate-binding protein [Clostridiaceae bacterium]|nr:ABC transporter substrate-binding protein [Clostridiaceae bacterium]